MSKNIKPTKKNANNVTISEHALQQLLKVSKETKKPKGTRPGQGKPKLQQLPDGTVVFKYREFITNIYSTSGTLDSTAYKLNAGNTRTFPTLGKIAQLFQQWKARKIRIMYKPLVSQAAATSGSVVSTGCVILSAQYDVNSDPYDTKQEMENSYGSASVAPWKTMHMDINVKKNNTVLDDLYVSTNNDDSDRFKDLGFFQVACSGIPTGGTQMAVGELWIEYDMVLMKPQMPNGTMGQTSQMAEGQNAGTSALFSSMVNEAGSTALVTFPDTVTNLKIAFDPNLYDGSYLILISWVGLSGVFGLPIPTFANCSMSVNWNGDAAAQAYAPQGGVTTQNAMWAGIAVIQNPTGTTPATITFASGVVPGNSKVNVFVTPVNGVIASG